MSAGVEPVARPAPVDVVGPSAVWLGDAARAIEKLAASPSVAAEIVALLQLSGAPAPERVAPARVPQVVPVRPPPPPTTAAEAAAITTPSVADATGETAGPPTELIFEPPSDALAPRDLPDLDAILPAATGAPDLQPVPLLAPARQRAVLVSLASSPDPIGDADVDLLVARLAARQPVRDLPRRPFPTTRRGLQLLVDFGEGMRGFVADRDEVWAAVERVAGADGVEVLRFAVTPLDQPGAGPGPKRTWKPYETDVVTRRPVLVLSDLGTRGPPTDRAATVRRWLDFAGRVRRGGGAVVALVPVPVERVDPELRRQVGVVAWDRGTGVRHAVAAARRAART